MKKLLLLTLLSFTAQADVLTYVGDQYSGTHNTARNAWKAQVDALGINRVSENFEQAKWDSMRNDGCYSSSCLKPPVTSFANKGLVWDTPGGSIRIIDGNPVQGKYSMRMIPDDMFTDPVQYSVSVKNSNQLSYGACLSFNASQPGVEVTLTTNGNSFHTVRLGYTESVACFIDTDGFSTLSLTTNYEPPAGGQVHYRLFSTDKVMFTRTSTVPYFGDLVSTELPEGECPAGQWYDAEGGSCEDL